MNLLWKISNGSLKLPKKIWFTKIFKQSWAPIIVQLQLVRYWSGYFHNTIAWAKIIHLGHNPYQQQNFKIYSILQGHKNQHREIIGTRYIIINMRLFVFLKSGKKSVIWKEIQTYERQFKKIFSLSTLKTLSSYEQF